MADSRLKAVYDAASHLFITKGYANTQVSQIAEKANIATGTVYNLFSGKKSILHFVLLCTLDKHYLAGEIELPIGELDEDELIVQHLSPIVEGLLLQIDRVDGEPLPFVEMLSILFDYVAGYHVAFSIINDNRSSLEKIEAKYRDYVNHLYKVVEENLLHYIGQGEVRRVEMPGLHLRNIFEGITWWAMYLPYQAPEVKLPVPKAKEIALDILKHAYLTKPE